MNYSFKCCGVSLKSLTLILHVVFYMLYFTCCRLWGLKNLTFILIVVYWEFLVWSFQDAKQFQLFMFRAGYEKIGK